MNNYIYIYIPKQKIAGKDDISKPPIGGITLRKTLKYGSVTVKREIE
jgi:hypothetical protein